MGKKTTNKKDLEAANLPTFDELQEMAAELDEPTIDEPARDIVNKRRNETKLEKAMREARQEKLKDSPKKEPYKITLTAGGEPLPIDPDTGEIKIDELTDDQRAELEAAAKKISNAVKAVFDNSAFNELQEKIKSFATVFSSGEMRDALKKMQANLQPIQELLNDLDELKPFIKAELKKNPDEYNGLSFDEILDHTPVELLEQLQDKNSPLSKVLAASRKARQEAERVTITRAEKVEYPLDKISGKAWNLLTEDKDGQLEVTFELLPKKRNLQATAYYTINFDELGDDLKITKRLQPFDKRVYIAVSALYNAGNEVITLSQIYYAMGNTGKPSPNQIKKIDDAVTKMYKANILLDNTQEARALKGKYPLFRYDGHLLPIERITAIINGQVTESAIHIFREPPLMTFAKEREQVTTVNVTLLQSPVSKTDANLQIDDYLIERISKVKNGKGNTGRILYKTLYERARITTTKQKQRAPEKIEKYLTYYQEQGFIKRFTMEKDGITVYF